MTTPPPGTPEDHSPWAPPAGPSQAPPPPPPPPSGPPPAAAPPAWSYAPPLRAQPHAAQPYTGQPYGTPPGAQPPGAPAMVPLSEELPNPPSSRRWKIIAPAAAVVVAAAAVGVYLAANGSSGSGGASSPEAAVRDAAAAIVKQDPSALIDVLNPGEVKSLGSLLDLVRGKIAKTGAVAATGALEPWLSLSASDISLTSHKETDDITFVEITGGKVSSTVNQTAMPSSIRPAHPTTVHQTGSLAGAMTSNHGKPVEIATIKISGRWYISPSTTELANATTSNGLPAPDFAHPATLGTGSDTPEGALTGFLTAISKDDYAAAAGYLSAKEVPALPYYYNELADNISGSSGQLAGLAPKLTMTVEDMSNGLKKVVISGGSVSGQGLSGSYSRGCLTSDQLPGPMCISPTFTRLSGIKDPFVVVEQNDGKWQISTVGTFLEYLRVVFTNGSLNGVYRALGLERLTPVVATLHTAQSAQVPINDAGFAHVHIVGKPGDCVPFEDADGHFIAPGGFAPFFLSQSGSSGESSPGGPIPSCDGPTIPDTGTYDAIIFGKQEYGKTVTVDLRSP